MVRSMILQNRQSAMTGNLSAMKTICASLALASLAGPARAADATLIVMVALRPAWLHVAGESLDGVAGAIPISGSFQQTARSGMFGGPERPEPSIVRFALAIAHVSGPHPPFLILYGGRDMPR